MGVTAKATRLDRLVPKYKSKWEQAYAETVLEPMLRAGEILWYKYEGIRLRLADGALYSPDFPVVAKDGTLEIHEVKGMWREAAKVRWRVVRESFPFVFRLVTRARNGKFTVTEE